jgi:hypothetical protein
MNLFSKWIALFVILFVAIGSVALAGNEEKVDLKDVPNAVKAAVTNLINGITLTAAEKETAKDGTVTWELEGTVAGLLLEIEVSDAGKILEIETEDPDDDDDDDNDDGDDDDEEEDDD